MVYEDEEDFEVERVIPRAIRLDIYNTRRRIEVDAKVIPTMNFGFKKIEKNLFTIKLGATNQTIGSSYYRNYLLTQADQQILLHNSRNNPSNGFYEYDLTIKPISFDVEPGEYFFAIIFTLSEQ